MIKPQPKTYKCTSCGWSKTVASQGDALSLLDYFEECPKCGNENLETVSASSIDVAANKIKDLFK
jgi:Zn finger protein HypA/HybF involved in hydrogenase expression